ncbi:MAG: triose-phosphate isomerase [Rhodospirillales bacterium]|nr:triose-phosphate isomerase [Rhodospirillales bacterium]MBL6942648.1 triose-phosphate isomerase [Rhodospirillales bacterium]
MSAARRILIAGNWKMNGLQGDGVALASAVAGKLQSAGDVPFDMLVCPPYTLIGAVVAVASGTSLQVGAQDCHTAEKGAHTGDISTAMLADAGCSSIIVGHSERRADHGESDELVRSKAEAVNAAGLNAIICIGETEAERDAGETLNVVKTQIAGSVPDSATAANTVVAYEPVWAIGTGRTPTSDEVQEVHAFIRRELADKLGQNVADGVRLLYGGSMNPANARELLALADVDGGLIGGASLKPEDFWTIGESCP